MKQIAFFQSDLRVGGIQKSLVNILREIDYEKCHVDLYLYDNESFFDWPASENLRIRCLSPAMRSIDRFIPFEMVRAMAKDVTGGKRYDVAVDFNSYQNECAVGTIKANADKRVMWVHNDVEIKLKNEPKYRVLWHFFKGKFKHYDAFAAVSPGIIDGFRRAAGVADKPIVSIPNHIDTQEILRKKDLPVDFAVDPDKLNLCSVGRLCHQKGYDILLGHLAEVKKARQDFMMYFIGDGPDRKALESQAASLGLAENVVFLGNQPNPFAYMDKMDGFVLTSRYEGQGMVIWEAKALGLPLYISKNLEAYNPGIRGREDMVEALIHAEKPEKKEYDDLADYNRAISRSLMELLGLAEVGREEAVAEPVPEPEEEGEPMVGPAGVEIAAPKPKEAPAARERNGILICGAYGLGNVGDEAILSAILREMEEVAPWADVTVLSRNPKETAARHGVKAVYMFDLPKVWSAMNKAALYLNGGGSLIQNVTSRRSLWYYLYTLKAAKARGCKVLMYGCGIGPVRNEKDVALTRDTLNSYVDVITLREPDSMEELERMGVNMPRVYLTADPALTLARASDAEVDRTLEKAGIPPKGNYICFALRKWQGFDEKAAIFGAAARYAYEKYGFTPVFAAVERRQDPEAGRRGAAGLDIHHYFLDDAGEVGTIIGALARMKVVVSMRLHALIFAASQGVPLVGVVYDQKVSSFLHYMEQDLYLPLEELTEEKLKKLIDEAAAKSEDRSELLARAEELRKVERGNREEAAILWKEGAV